ncbi:MAG: decaprenyl-phosphate phosphoribosyltransferase [Myxococcota bacterium]
MAAALIRAMRPKQWAKNVFLFAAIVFSLQFDNSAAWIQTGLAFAAFCCISSSGYIFNDALDKEADAKHPKKKFRPIASGALPLGLAYVEMAVLFVTGSVLAYIASPWVLLVAWLYFANTMSYTFYFKHLVILDIMFIASGFLWRVVAGAVAINVPTSPWLLTCTAFLALFLGFNKRRGELMVVKGSETRKNLKEYTPELVAEFQAITTSGTIISYALYTVLGPHDNPWLLITLPYVLYGIFRYIYLVTAKNEGGAPDETLLKDKPILINGLLYVVTLITVLVLTEKGF